jgi:DNA-directed RNA polymerase subunit H (RpoH/RPB5)
MNPEDVGYETARIRGVDVLGQLSIMMRQRGWTICKVGGLAVESCVSSEPLDHVPSESETADAEAWMHRQLSRPGVRMATTTPWHPVIVASLGSGPPPGTSAHVHVQRGIETVGDEAWVFLIPTDKVGVKQLRGVAEAYSGLAEDSRPRRVIVISREKFAPATMNALRVDNCPIVAERFLMSELSYNVTRHFLVPAHRVCDVDEVSRLRRRFPKLALQGRDDMISRFHGLLAGDVVVYRRQRLGSYGGEYYREVT